MKREITTIGTGGLSLLSNAGQFQYLIKLGEKNVNMSIIN
jgi:hypothetical protein